MSPEVYPANMTYPTTPYNIYTGPQTPHYLVKLAMFLDPMAKPQHRIIKTPSRDLRMTTEFEEQDEASDAEGSYDESQIGNIQGQLDQVSLSMNESQKIDATAPRHDILNVFRLRNSVQRSDLAWSVYYKPPASPEGPYLTATET